MRSSLGTLAIGVALLGLGAPLAAEAPARPAVREGMQALEVRLDRAVDRVSLPHAARLLGRIESARGYRLPGYGVVLVLTPRVLPGGEGQVYFVQGGGSKLHRLRVQTKAKNPQTTVVVDIDEGEGVETFERQVLVLQHETEAARRAAEEEMERIVRDVRVRISPPPPVPEPAPPAALGPAVPPQAPEAPEAPAPPQPVAWAPKAPPPWKFWFETGAPAEKRTPEAVIADVRASLVDALVAPGPTFAGLGGDERVTVAVDFVPGGLFAANAAPERTLVVSVRARDVAARARGSITPEELRRRVEVNEY